MSIVIGIKIEHDEAFFLANEHEIRYVFLFGDHTTEKASLFFLGTANVFHAPRRPDIPQNITVNRLFFFFFKLILFLFLDKRIFEPNNSNIYKSQSMTFLTIGDYI